MRDDRSDQDWGFGREFRNHFDPSAFSFARSFRKHGGMKYYILWLVSQKPMRGSEIMEEVQKQTMGWWRPSPGTIYPLLSSLEKDELVHRLGDLRYEITNKGAQEIGIKKGTTEKAKTTEETDIDKTVSEIESYISYLEEEQEKLESFSTRIDEMVKRLSKLKKD